jgi:predicted esterase
MKRTRLRTTTVAFLAALLAAGAAWAQEAHLSPGREAELALPACSSSMRLYVPKDYTPERAWPVIFCYHGYRGRPTTKPFRQVTDGKGFVIVGCAYATEEYGNHINRDLLEPEKTYFEAALRAVGERLHIDKDLVFMGGFSQGGYSTTVLGEALVERLAGLVILGAGRSYREKYGPPASAIVDKPVFIGVGATGETHCPRARKAAEVYRGWGADVTYEEWPGKGHSSETKETALGAWLVEKGPLRKVKTQVAAAQKARAAARLGRAYALYRAASLVSDEHEMCRAATAEAKTLADFAEKKLAEAEEAVEAKAYLSATRLLALLAARYERSPFGERAAERLAELQADPEIGPAIVQARIDGEAEALERKACTAEEAGEFAEALRLYGEYVAKFGEATRYGEVVARYEALRGDEGVQASMRDEEADRCCNNWLNMADNFLQAGLPEKARPYLELIIETYGDTEWAAKARERLESLPGT